MRSTTAAALAFAGLGLLGCSFNAGETGVPNPAGGDGFIDADPDEPMFDGAVADAVPDADTTCDPADPLGFEVSNFNPCQLPPVQAGKTTLTGQFDSGIYSAPNALALPQLHPTGPEVLVLYYEHVEIDRVLFSGSRPVVIVADTIEISGAISVRSNSRTGRSPGADALCGDDGQGKAGGPNPITDGYDGGSGGGYGTSGGKGGEADGGGSKKTAPGLENGNPEITPLRGGCRGGLGGRPEVSILALITDLIAGPGSGGGGLQLVARTSITVTDSGGVYAPGRGGGTFFITNHLVTAGIDRSGGSGGGSGGAILMEAPDITIADGAVILALGGGGGEGRDNESDQPSAIGGSAPPVGDAIPASGGDTGGQSGGKGGDGSSGNGGSKGGDGGKGSDLGSGEHSGGGGGGGGNGRIRLRAVGGTLTVDGDVIPPPLEG